jgi:hypothetical protein
MRKSQRSLLSLGVIALCAAAAAQAQESNTVIGPPQLKDFTLEGRRQVVAPQPFRPPTPAVTPPATAEPRVEAPERPRTERTVAAPRREPTATQPTSPTETQPPPQPPGADQPVAPEPAPASAPAAPAADATSAGRFETLPSWLYAILAAAILALLGLVAVRRRRRRRDEVEPVFEERAAEMAPAPVKPRPDPIPRPWLELALKAERASFTDSEAELQFELEISNKGGSAARNLRIDVKMFNGGVDQQDREIGTFFRTAGREATKLHLSEVAAGITGVIQGRVTLAREEMRAVKLDERLLFIPVVAVNALYDWGEGRTGQTSKSYVIGRELQQTSEKMGAFRVDQGPRVWRTVAQRDHNLAKRV